MQASDLGDGVVWGVAGEVGIMANENFPSFKPILVQVSC